MLCSGKHVLNTLFPLCSIYVVKYVLKWIHRGFIWKTSTSRELCIQKRKTRTKLAASEGYWRLPSSPIVGKKHKVFLCKFFITGNMYWIRFPRHVQFMSWNMDWSEFIEDLCEKCSTSRELSIEKRKTRTKLTASEGAWRLPSSPISGTKT